MELFYCYAYGRLSKEDGDKIESDSIKNQRDLIHSYIGQHPELKLVMEGGIRAAKLDIVLNRICK